MAIEVRAATDDEFDTMLEVDRRGFGGPPRKGDEPLVWHHAHLDRTRCAFDNGELVSCSRGYPFELTMPGGATVPVSAISAVAVQPSHRRRGLLNAMMGGLFDDAREHGEVAAVLTASESSIYGRYGYGIATWRLAVRLERAHARFARPVDDPGRVRMVDHDEARKVFPEVYEQVRRRRPGMVSRPDYWWPDCYREEEPGTAYFYAVHEDAAGAPDGAAWYELKGSWSTGIPEGNLVLEDLQTSDAVARAALWEYLIGVDLMATVEARHLPIDDPLRFLLADSRRMKVAFVNDQLWLCPLDVAALLRSRTYGAEGRVVLAVDDERVDVDGGPQGATVTATSRDADLSCSRATLGALSLGGNSWATLRDAGLVAEHTDGAVARADAMFSCAPAPATLSWF